MKLQIDIENLKKVTTNLNNLVNEYEIAYKNIFKELEESSIYWKDNVSEKFYNELNNEKLKFEKEDIKLSEEIKTFENIILSYSTFGEKIKCNLNSKQEVSNKIGNIKTELIELANNYEKINIPFDVELQEVMIKQKQLLKTITEQINDLKAKIEDDYKNIEIKENKIKKEIGDMQKVIIEEYDNTKYIKE